MNKFEEIKGIIDLKKLQNERKHEIQNASDPAGQLFYEPLRDKKTIIAGGSGITPFYSMAGAIADGTIDANLIILYGSRTHNHILLGDELDRIAAKTDKVKVVNILSDEEVVMW